MSWEAVRRALLASLAVRFPILSLAMILVVFAILYLLGFRMGWSLVTKVFVIACVMATVGAGLDLHARSIWHALMRFLPACVAGALSIGVLDQIVGRLGGYANEALTPLLAIEIYIPFLTLMFLGARWSAIRAAKKVYERGTAIYNPEDATQRAKVKKRFRALKRQ